MKVIENTPDRLVLETFEVPKFYIAYAFVGGGLALGFLGALSMHPVGIAGLLVAATGALLARRPHARRLVFERTTNQFREETPCGWSETAQVSRSVALADISDAEIHGLGRSVTRTNPDPMSIHNHGQYRTLRIHLQSGEILEVGQVLATQGHTIAVDRVINDWLALNVRPQHDAT